MGVATDLLKNLVFLKYSEICEFLEKFHVKMEEKNEKPKVKTKRRVPGLVPICDSRKRPLPQLKPIQSGRPSPFSSKTPLNLPSGPSQDKKTRGARKNSYHSDSAR